MSKPTRDVRFEATIVKLMAYCKENGVTAHTAIKRPSLTIRKNREQIGFIRR